MSHSKKDRIEREARAARGEGEFILDGTLAFAVNRTAYLMRQRTARAIGAHGLETTPEECVVLCRLAEQDGRSQGEIAEATLRDRTTVTRLIDGMVRKGLVRREPSTQDRRVVCAWLTDRGRRHERRLLGVVRDVLHEITAGVADGDLAATVRTLQTIQRALVDGEERKGES